MSTQMAIDCDAGDEFKYGLYSFPQNNMQVDGRSNLRTKEGWFDPTAQYSISLGSPVANFTVDDVRIDVSTTDDQNFVLSAVPDSLQEVWFSFVYLDFFGSNEVGVIGSNDSG